jgi:hypothetical protein
MHAESEYPDAVAIEVPAECSDDGLVGFGDKAFGRRAETGAIPKCRLARTIGFPRIAMTVLYASWSP